MTQEENASRRIQKLKELVAIYFELPDKANIERHKEKLRIFEIRESVHTNHPHKTYRVYISRRALKHVVEERKRDLLRSHTSMEVIRHIIFAIDKIQDTIADFDLYEYEPPKHLYTKDYLEIDMPSVRIVLDSVGNTLEICSIHFNRYIARRNRN